MTAGRAMTADTRFVDERCHAYFSLDMLRRHDYRCEFRAGHTGLHYCGTPYTEGYPAEPRPAEVMRWGTEAELTAEVNGHLTGDWSAHDR